MSDTSHPTKTIQTLKGDDDGVQEPLRPGSFQGKDSVGEAQKFVRMSNLDSRYIPPVLDALSVPDIVLIIMSHVKDLHGWDNIFLSTSFDAVRDRDELLLVVESFLALGLVNHFWRNVFQGFHSPWAVIPATLANRLSSLMACMRLSGHMQMTLTLRYLQVDEEIMRALRTVADRLTGLRLSCERPSQFYELVRHNTADGQQSLIATVTALEVLAEQLAKKTPFWLRTPPPHLTNLRLTNFAFTKHCVLPAALTSLALEYTEPPPWYHKLGKPMDLDDFMGVLSHLPLLEMLFADLRYMPQILLSAASQVDLPVLKCLTVRAREPKAFNDFASCISCPLLKHGYVIIELATAKTLEVAHDFRAASERLAQLTLRASHRSSGQPDVVEFGHIYLDDRGEPFGKNGRGVAVLTQATVAIASRGDALPLVDDEIPINRIALTAAFVLTVTRSIEPESRSDRDSSSVIGLILEGLPRLDVESLTIHFRPEEPLPLEEDTPNDKVWVFRDTNFLKLVTSARRLNWLGSSVSLAKILRQRGSFRRLSYLAIGLPEWEGFPVLLEKAVEDRKVRARDAAPVDGLSEDAAASLRRQVWKAPLLLPEAKENVMGMFDELLEVVGRRVV
ncbi:hypothetical protein PENSPDRAFT_688410 [Peniophora sp. CONT]|nr:hypothetical protein PENSPDRAFT_688410 [Peniophora sp. CONT]